MTIADEEDNQHSETSVDDIPEDPPDPSTSPDQPARQENKPPSVELKGKRTSQLSFKDKLTSGNVGTQGPSTGDEDPWN